MSDSKTTRLAASGAASGGPGRVTGIHFIAGATVGSITITDGNGGPTLAVFDTPASVAASGFIDLSGSPIRCETSIYCVLAVAPAVTVIYNG